MLRKIKGLVRSRSCARKKEEVDHPSIHHIIFVVRAPCARLEVPLRSPLCHLPYDVLTKSLALMKPTLVRSRSCARTKKEVDHPSIHHLLLFVRAPCARLEVPLRSPLCHLPYDILTKFLALMKPTLVRPRSCARTNKHMTIHPSIIFFLLFGRFVRVCFYYEVPLMKSLV